MPFFGGGGGGGGLYSLVGAEINNNISGGENVMALVTGVNNMGLNNGALQNITSGGNNIAIGAGAGGDLTSGDENVLIGTSAGGAFTTGRYNVGVGYKTLETETGEKNVAIGHSAMDSTTNCFSNVAIGYGAMESATNADNCVVVTASDVGLYSDYSVFVGGAHNPGGITMSVGEVAIGGHLRMANSAPYSVLIGYNATHGGAALGAVTIGAETDGSYEFTVCIGYNAGTNAANSVSIGAESTATNAGVSVGYSADCDFGVAVGNECNANSEAVVVGPYAQGSSQGVALGKSANASGTKAIAIGYEVTAAANTIKIGDSTHTTITIGGKQIAGVYTWATLPAPSSGLAGTVVWCSDYPGPVAGAQLMCTGSRWRPVGQRRALLNYFNGTTGLVVAAGAAEALFGVSVLVKGGMIIPGDRIRVCSEMTQAALSDAGVRTIRVRSAATEAGLLAGSHNVLFSAASIASNIFTLDKNTSILTNTAGRSVASGAATAQISTAALSNTSFSNLSADSYHQFSAANASSQDLTIISLSYTVEYQS